MEGFRIEMEQELQTLRFELEDEGKAMLGILKWLYSYHIYFYILLTWNSIRNYKTVLLKFETSELLSECCSYYIWSYWMKEQVLAE